MVEVAERARSVRAELIRTASVKDTDGRVNAGFVIGRPLVRRV